MTSTNNEKLVSHFSHFPQVLQSDTIKLLMLLNQQSKTEIYIE